jgi:hypothetical protein
MDEIKKIMFKLHTHAELLNPEEVCYKEKDVLLIIEKAIELKQK